MVGWERHGGRTMMKRGVGGRCSCWGIATRRWVKTGGGLGSYGGTRTALKRDKADFPLHIKVSLTKIQLPSSCDLKRQVRVKRIKQQAKDGPGKTQGLKHIKCGCVEKPDIG